MSKIESVQIINKTKWKIIKENLLLDSFCFNNKLEKNWHKRLDINDDDIIFKKLMNPIIHLFQIFDRRRVKMIQILILQKIIGKLFIMLANNQNPILSIYFNFIKNKLF